MIAVLVRELDDPSVPMAETCRQVGDRAQALGLVRPSLVHLRTLVRDERDRRDAERARRETLRELAGEIMADNNAGRVTSARYIIDRLLEAGGR